MPPRSDQDEQTRRLWLATTGFRRYNQELVRMGSCGPGRSAILGWDIPQLGKRESRPAGNAPCLERPDVWEGQAVDVGDFNGSPFRRCRDVGAGVVDLTVECPTGGSSQEFWIDSKRNDVPAIIGSLVANYKPHLNGASPEAIGRQIDGVHLRTMDTNEASDSGHQMKAWLSAVVFARCR